MNTLLEKNGLVSKKNKIEAPSYENIVNDSPREFSEADFPVGTVAHQGDLILIRVDSLPATVKNRESMKLVDGDTQGSRHVLQTGLAYDCVPAEMVEKIKAACPKSNIGERYIGPVFKTSFGLAELVHPEHGNHIYKGDMTIACVFQRNLDAEQREQRVKD